MLISSPAEINIGNFDLEIVFLAFGKWEAIAESGIKSIMLFNHYVKPTGEGFYKSVDNETQLWPTSQSKLYACILDKTR